MNGKMSGRKRERGSPELEGKLLEYRQWARTYGGYHASSTVPKQIRTIRRYGEICDMMNPKENLEFILDELVRNSEKGVKPQTLNHVIYDIEAWARFLGQPMVIPRFKQSAAAEPWIPTDQEVQKIRDTANKSGNRAIASRNRLVVDLLFAGGMRIGELIKLNLSNVDGKLLTVPSEKGEAPRVIGLPESVSARMQEYIEKYRSQTDREALFTTTVGRMNYNYARSMIKSIAMKSGATKFHAHAARHWCATTLLKRDSHGRRLDIREVQIHLGHKSLSSTQVYTHLKEREVAEHSSEHMEEFFRMRRKCMDSIINNQIIHGTDSEHGGTVEI
ncbi:MAG: tyrosine-type recombinase/integrase [Candidatus Thermoplasmatota archaeon]|nr:tyrosine-type recombinase/integrase [Candidatus Thermoplasmatota archaeon]MCL5888909.1 tyrosine-type recombinase/integrase [Candidatus Thermoplasmatota archaeon]